MSDLVEERDDEEHEKFCLDGQMVVLRQILDRPLLQNDNVIEGNLETC